MEQHRRAGILVDFTAIFVSFYLTYYIASALKGEPIFSTAGSIYLRTILAVMGAWTLSLLLFADYPVRRLTGILQEWRTVFRVNAIGLLLFGFVSFVMHTVEFSRLYVALYSVDTVFLMSIIRYAIRLYLAARRQAGLDTRTRMIVGSGTKARLYLEQLQSNRDRGIQVLGYVADDEDCTMDISYLGKVKDLPDILARHHVDGLVVALSMGDLNLESVVRASEQQGVMIELLLNGLLSRMTESEVVYGMGVPRLVLSNIPQDKNALLWKRLTDIGLSLLSLLVLLPVFFVIAIAIKLDDSGPVFFAQLRAGLRGRPFRMYKFRSMVTEAEELRGRLEAMNEMSGPVFKIRDDPRITRVGRFLRRTSLDELPQLWNVLLGQMSLVGPRPPLPMEVDAYDYAHRRRLSVKPGMTCLWQISGRNNVDFDRWMELDLAYIDNWSYLEDVKIMLKTIPAVLHRHGAS